MRKTVTLAAALTALCMMTGASAITDDFTDLTAEDIMSRRSISGRNRVIRNNGRA